MVAGALGANVHCKRRTAGGNAQKASGVKLEA
jgi:hypothetical protein